MSRRRFERPQPFAVAGRCTDAGCAVTVEGEIDLCTSPAIDAEIRRHDHADDRPLELDLIDVTFMDSSGLKVLMLANERLDRDGRELRVVAPGGAALHAIELTGLQHVLRLATPAG